MDLDAERIRVLERDAEWSKLVAEGRDIDSILSYWTDDAVVIPRDASAYMLSDNAVTMHGPDGKPSRIDGRVVTIWRREPEGQWRCAVDNWNSESGA